MQDRHLNLLLWLWAAGAVCSAIAHLAVPSWTSAGTTWPMSEHWQREIAWFDLFAAALFVWTTRQSEAAVRRFVSLLLCALSLVLGENHLEGWLHQPRIFHVMFTILNGLALLWAGLAYRALGQRTD
jgi:hypothetical protein